MRRIPLLVVIVALVAGCGDEAARLGSDSADGKPEAVSPGDGADDDAKFDGDAQWGKTDEPEIRPDWVRVFPEPDRVVKGGPAPITGEVPGELMARILADAADRTGVTAAAFEVLRAQFVEWPDGSLGCPEPVEPGYWVELQAGDTVLDYRATTRGWFKVCPTGLGGLRLEYPGTGTGTGTGQSTDGDEADTTGPVER